MDLLLTRLVGSRPKVLYHLTSLILSRVACPIEDRGWTVSCQSTNSSNAPRVLFRGSFIRLKKYKYKLCRWTVDMILKKKKDPNLGANSFAFLVGPIQCIPRFIHLNNLIILAGEKKLWAIYLTKVDFKTNCRFHIEEEINQLSDEFGCLGLAQCTQIRSDLKILLLHWDLTRFYCKN